MSRVETLSYQALIAPFGTLAWYVAQIRLCKRMVFEARKIGMSSLAEAWERDVFMWEESILAYEKPLLSVMQEAQTRLDDAIANYRSKL